MNKDKTMSNDKTVIVTKDAAKPEPDEIIAKAIIEMSDGVRKLMAGPLKFETLVLLLHAASGIAKRDVRLVMQHMEALRRTYVK